MINPKHRGEPTYRRTILRAIFEGYDYLKQLMTEIALEAQGKVEGNFQSIDVMQLPDTMLGPHAELNIKDDSTLKYEIGLFRDGWHIKLFVHNTWPSAELQKEIFGELNRTEVWTQETEKVASLIAELAQEARMA
jgi:hypothetical protein